MAKLSAKDSRYTENVPTANPTANGLKPLLELQLDSAAIKKKLVEGAQLRWRDLVTTSQKGLVVFYRNDNAFGLTRLAQLTENLVIYPNLSPSGIAKLNIERLSQGKTPRLFRPHYTAEQRVFPSANPHPGLLPSLDAQPRLDLCGNPILCRIVRRWLGR